MPDKFDPYREALVIETRTIWPEGFDEIDEARREQISTALHSEPDNAAILDYLRVHTGFCRQITITDEDIARVTK